MEKIEQTSNVFTKLAESDNPVVAILAVLVLSLAGVVIYQWRYAMTKTVPKWIWDSMIVKLEQSIDVQNKIMLILDERLKK
jgi:hypothetical protein